MCALRNWLKILSVTCGLSLCICILKMCTAREDLRCDPEKKMVYNHSKLNADKTVDCDDVITKYTTDVPLYLGLFAIFHIAKCIAQFCLNNVDDLLKKSAARKIFGLLKRTIIWVLYVWYCVHVYHVILSFGWQEFFWQAIPSTVPCNATNGNVEICQLKESVNLNNILMVTLAMSGVIIIILFCEIVYIVVDLFKSYRYRHVPNTDH